MNVQCIALTQLALCTEIKIQRVSQMPTTVDMLPCVYKLHLSVITMYSTHVHLSTDVGMMHIHGACKVLLTFELRVHMLDLILFQCILDGREESKV